MKLDVGSPATSAGGDDSGGEATGCRDIALLFVVDISASMGQEKANLSANFPAFIEVMDEYSADTGNGAQGYRLGVTKSTIVDNGIDQSTMGLDGRLFAGRQDDCGTGTTPWLEGPDAELGKSEVSG